jgi:hypothetical protein
MTGSRIGILSAILASLLFAGSAAASCVLTTRAEQRARAAVIFDGVAFGGPTTTGFERFRVTRYLKGSGPRIFVVSTGRKRFAGGGGMVTSVSITARRGEIWRIYARRLTSRSFQANVCDGSRRLR